MLDEEHDKDHIDELISRMPVEQQKILGIFDLERELQRSIFVKQKNTEIKRDRYLIKESPEKFMDYLDKKIEEKRATESAMHPALL
jgi:hypothetical protein